MFFSTLASYEIGFRTGWVKISEHALFNDKFPGFSMSPDEGDVARKLEITQDGEEFNISLVTLNTTDKYDTTVLKIKLSQGLLAIYFQRFETSLYTDEQICLLRKK